MQKLNSFAEFSAAKAEINTAKLQEEQEAKRSKEAKTFTSLLSEYGVTAIKELDEDQKIEFFEKLRGAKVNEATELIEEGTRGQFGKIDKKGNIVSIYTHYDSYPENVLPLIKKGYKGGKNVDAVIKGGNSSGLEATPADMNFYKDGSKNLKGSIANVDGYLQAASDDGGAEYVYLWDEANKEWLMADIYGNRELVPAFENLSVSVNEAIKVEYKRDAKKVVTQYKKIFYKALPDLGAMSTTSILGCVKYICQEALGDANFHREAEPTAKKIKGKIEALEIKMPGLGGHFIKIGPTTIKSILDKHYSDIANAAGWSGIGIAEGTALFLEELKQEQMGQDVLDAFNAIYAANESVVNESEAENILDDLLDERGGDMGELHGMEMEDALDTVETYGHKGSKAKKIAKELHSLCNESVVNESEAENILQDLLDERGGDMGELHGMSIEDAQDTVETYGHKGSKAKNIAKELHSLCNESVVTEAEIKSDEEFQEYAYGILKKAFADDFDQAKADEVVNGILRKSDGDYGKAAGILQSSLA